MLEEAKAEGFTASALRRAKAALGVRSLREGGLAGDGAWVWKLPEEQREQ